MDIIVSEMNSRRLSTNKGIVARLDRTSLSMMIERLLSGPSNCEIKEGKT